jgi:hypothetical protein
VRAGAAIEYPPFFTAEEQWTCRDVPFGCEF